MSSNRVYLDHNSTSPLRPEVVELWRSLLDKGLGNPSSLHRSGRLARHVIDTARERVAGALGVEEQEVLFTSGGTESNNLALWGSLEALGPETSLLITRTEHSSVLEVARRAEQLGTTVTWLEVGASGLLDRGGLREELQRASSPLLVSVHAANNEVGTVQPLAEIREALDDSGVSYRLHTDAVQALGRIPLSLRAVGCELASISAHKVGGPIGVGVLYRRTGCSLMPRNWGGGQEFGIRPGTENAAQIAAAALAIELAVQDQDKYVNRIGALTTQLWEDLEDALPGVRLLGPSMHSPERLPNTLSVLLPGTDGKVLVTALDLAGMEVSAGSACASGSLEPSHVLQAMGLDTDQARAGLRLSLGWSTTAEDCQRAVDILRKITTASHAT